jgi:hypothetical protein
MGGAPAAGPCATRPRRCCWWARTPCRSGTWPRSRPWGPAGLRGWTRRRPRPPDRLAGAPCHCAVGMGRGGRPGASRLQWAARFAAAGRRVCRATREVSGSLVPLTWQRGSHPSGRMRTATNTLQRSAVSAADVSGGTDPKPTPSHGDTSRLALLPGPSAGAQPGWTQRLGDGPPVALAAEAREKPSSNDPVGVGGRGAVKLDAPVSEPRRLEGPEPEGASGSLARPTVWPARLGSAALP